MIVESIDQDCCPISLESYEDLRRNNNLVCTPCGHLFQDISLFQWLEYQQTCPSCRKIVRLPDINYGNTPKPTILCRIAALFRSCCLCTSGRGLAVNPYEIA